MTVTFFSSVLNHHQITFCEELNNTSDVTFTFVQMKDLTDERRAQGFTAYDKPYVVYAQREPERARRLCIESDVVIAGVIDQSWANERAAMGKLTFAYKERFLKSAKSFFSPAFWKNGYLNFFRYRNKELYFLCASSYTARDTRFIFPRADKKLKWGYFPIINIHSDAEGVLEGKEKGTAIWVGRFLELKHPDTCIELAKRLRDDGVKLNISMVGLGEMQPTLEQMIKDESLEEYVSILGQMSPEQVKEQMRKNEIFLFTSDRKEGWGAVLNEAMSEGCACISSRQAGSTEFLIKDGENGLIFDYSDIDTLVHRVRQLIEAPEKMRTLQKNALNTIKNEWNAQTAAERLLAFCRCKLEGKEPPQYESGPMSVS